MAEYIEREALLKSLCNTCDGWCENTACYCVNCKSEHRCDMVIEIAEAPAANVVPVVHGRWISRSKIIRGCWDYRFDCSACGHIFWYGGIESFNYCPNCGCRMDGGNE